MNVKYIWRVRRILKWLKDKEHPFKVMAQGVEVNVSGNAL